MVIINVIEYHHSATMEGCRMDTARSSNGWWKTARRWACRRRDSGEVSSPYAKGSTPWINILIRHTAYSARCGMFENAWNQLKSYGIFILRDLNAPVAFQGMMNLISGFFWFVQIWSCHDQVTKSTIFPETPGDSRYVVDTALKCTESRSNANISKAMVSAQNCKGLRLCTTQPLKMINDGNVAWESPTSRARWTPTCHICHIHICHSHPEKCHSNATGGMTSPNASNMFKYHQMHSTCGFDAYVPESSM